MLAHSSSLGIGAERVADDRRQGQRRSAAARARPTPVRARASCGCAARISRTFWPARSPATRRCSGLRCGCSRIRACARPSACCRCSPSSAPACGPTVDLTKGLEVEIVTSGWFDVGIVNGQNKLVPSVTFTLKNLSTVRQSPLRNASECNSVTTSSTCSTQRSSASLTETRTMAPSEQSPASA